MALIDTLLSSLRGTANPPAGQDPLATALSGLLTQNGGLQGLMTRFSHGGLGDVFSSWVGMGQNQPISASQIQSVLGSNQIQNLASTLGVNQTEASQFLADHLPKIVDKLTPSGQVDPGTDHHEGLMAMLPSLLGSLSR